MDTNRDFELHKFVEESRERPIIYLESTDSTNSVAMEMAKQGAEAGTIVLAESQTMGRGRLGRVWQSPPGTGLYFSMILHSRLPVADLSKITLAAGVGLCAAVENVTGLAPLIKWPNDLLLGNKKFCGILTENYGRVADYSLIVVGVGLNVNTGRGAFSDELVSRVSSLAMVSGKHYNRSELLQEIVTSLDFYFNLLEQGDFPEILAMWRRKDATLDRVTTWLTPDNQVVTGISLGIDKNGLLHIKDDAGRVHEVLSGDVTLGGRHD